MYCKISKRLITTLLVIFMVYFSSWGLWTTNGYGQNKPVGDNGRPDPSSPLKLQSIAAVSVNGYCSSNGGDTTYERITAVNVTRRKGGFLIEVKVYIANPGGCTAGKPCLEYDPSPEHVNVWIEG